MYAKFQPDPFSDSTVKSADIFVSVFITSNHRPFLFYTLNNKQIKLKTTEASTKYFKYETMYEFVPI